MPVFKISTPDGRTLDIEAPDQDTALEGAEIFVKENPLTTKFESAARGAADTFSFGTADEITASLSSGSFFGANEGLWGDYDQELDETRAEYAKAQKDNPKTYLAGQVAGVAVPALASGGASMLGNTGRALYGAGNLAKGAGMGAAIKKGVGYGMAQGAGYGFGSGEDGLKNRAAGALVGAGFGAAGGAAGPLAGKAIGGAAEKAIDAGRGTVQKAAGLVGLAPNLTGAQRAGVRDVARMVQNSNIDLDDAVRNVAPGRPIASQSGLLANEAGSLARTTPKLRDTIDQQARSAFQTAREHTKQQMKANLGGADNSLNWVNTHRHQMKQGARKAYPAAFEATANRPVPDEIVGWLERQLYINPKLGHNASQQAGRTNIVTGKRDRNSERFIFNRKPTYEDLEYFRRAFADIANKEYRAGASGAGSAMDENQNLLRSVIDDNAQEIAEARAKYASDADIMRAFEQGKKAFSESGKPGDFEEIEYLFGKMGDAEAAAYSKGVWASARKGLAGQSPESVATFRKMLETEDGFAIMKLTQGEDAAQALYKRVSDLSDAGNLKFQTDPRRYDTSRSRADDARQGMVGNLADAGLAIGSGDTGGAVNAVKGMLKRFMANPPSDEQLEMSARVLMMENPEKLQALFRAASVGDSKAAEAIANGLNRFGAGAGGGSSRAASERLVPEIRLGLEHLPSRN